MSRARRLAVNAGLDMDACNSTTSTKKTLVTVSISTTNEAAYEALVALSQGDPSAAAALASTPIANAAGGSFALCTSTVVAGQTRAIDDAPSPPPPSPPPLSPPDPPLPPPFNLLPGGLDVLAFVNLSSPVASAFTQILEAQAGTVRAAAGVAVGAGVAASVAASALGGVAGGIPGPAALMGAQRQAVYGNLAGAPKTCEDPRSGGDGGGWTMGRLNLGGENPCKGGRRRQLQKKEGGGSGGGGVAKAGGGDEEDLVQQMLVQAMVDTLISSLLIIALGTGIHIITVMIYKFYWNDEYYAWVQPANVRTIKIRKPAGDRLGIGLFENTVERVDESSPCAGLLFPGDKLHLINGRPVLLGGWKISRFLRFLISLPALYRGDDVIAKRTSKRLQEASVLFILVSTPQSRLKARLKDVLLLGSKSFKVAAMAVSSNDQKPRMHLKWMSSNFQSVKVAPRPKLQKNGTEESESSVESYGLARQESSDYEDDRIQTDTPPGTAWSPPAAADFPVATADRLTSADVVSPLPPRPRSAKATDLTVEHLQGEAKADEAKRAAQVKKREELRSAFAVFDKDGSGAISVSELAAILGTPVKGKKPLTAEDAYREAETIIAKYDTNGGEQLKANAQRMHACASSLCSCR